MQNTQGGGCKSFTDEIFDSEVMKLLQYDKLVGDGIVTQSVDKESVKTAVYTGEVLVRGGRDQYYGCMFQFWSSFSNRRMHSNWH